MLSDNKPPKDAPGMVKYQFEIDEDEWDAWKQTVPRTKSLDTRLRELIRADTKGGDVAEASPTFEEAPEVETAETETTTELDIPQTVDPDDAADAIAAAKNVLEEEGSATKREIVASVMPKYPLGYDVDSALEKVDEGGRYRGAWWRRVIKAGLEADDDVEKPTGGRSDWQYTGE